MNPNQALVARLKGEATLWRRGHRYEDFEVGQTFVHHWGRTITEGDNTLFSSLTLHYNPLYTNLAYAKSHGHRATPVNPLLVFNTVFGLTVEDLSEGGGPFLGVEKLEYLEPVYPGDTVFARSEVVDKRSSENRPGFGIVTWHTAGSNQDERKVIDYQRSNLVRMRSAPPAANAPGAREPT